MLWVSGTNPLVSLPDLPKAREIFTKDSLFLVVQDIFPTETTAVADVVLPAAAWSEKTGCFTNVDRTVHIAHKAVEPPGEARADLDIFVDYSKRMDFRNKDDQPLMHFKEPEETFEAWKAVSKGRPCDYSGMTYEKLSQGTGIQWPCNEENPNGKERLFGDGIFYTDTEYCESFGHDLETGAPLTKAQYDALNPAGKAILKSCHYQPEAEGTSEEFPLQLSTGRRTRHFHTRTKTGRTKELQDKDPESYIQISEHDAKEIGIQDGDMVIAESLRGKVEVEARVGLMAKGQVFIPFHYGYFDSKDGRARAANELTQERWDPVSKQPMFKSGAVRVTKSPSKDGEVTIHEQQSQYVQKTEKESATFAGPGDVHTNDKLERMLEYWLGATLSSLYLLVDICEHIIPRVKGADFEISGGMTVMKQLTQSCLDKLQPASEHYKVDLELGHEASEALRHRLFPDNLIDVTGSPAYDVLVILQSFHLFLSHLEAHLFALEPTAQADWNADFADAVGHVSTQVDRMKAWNKQQMHSRGPQTLLVPCKQGAGLRDRVEEYRKEHDGKMP